MKTKSKLWTLEGERVFSKKWILVTYLLLKMTHIPTWPSQDINKKNILVKIILTIEAKLWTLESEQGFEQI